MTYILIMVLNVGSGLAIHSTQFNSKKACEDAKKAVQAEWTVIPWRKFDVLVCVPRGDA